MGFFRAAFVCVFFGASNTLFVIARRAKRTANATIFLVKNAFAEDSIPKFFGSLKSSIDVFIGIFLSCFVCLAFAVETVPSSQGYSWWGQPDPETGCRMAAPDLYGVGSVMLDWVYITAANGIVGSGLDIYCTVRAPSGQISGPRINREVVSETCPSNSSNPVSGLCTCNSGFIASGGECVSSRARNNGKPNSCTGNPINTGNGNKFQFENDYSGNGLASPGFSRSYNSASETGRGGLGAHWFSNYDQSLYLSTNGTSSVATLFRPDGKAFFFTLGNGVWLPDADISDTLVQIKDAGGNPVGWRYISSNDEIETYNAAGKLTSITNRAGLTQTLAYSDGTVGPNGGYVLDAAANPTPTVLPAGLLIRVTDATGRSLSLGYDASNRIVKMTDPAGGDYLYSYDANNNLASVTYPGSYKRIYLYENNTFYSSNQPHALTGIIDTTATDSTGANGTRYASYWYGAQGRVYKEEHAPNLNQGIDNYQLSYNTDPVTGNPTSTVVTDPLGTVRTYNFQTILGVVKSTGTDQPGGSGCAAVSSAMTYDANGNLSSRADFNQHKTCYAYDLARNLETARVEGLLSTADCATALAATTFTGDARKITTTWHANYRLPLVITEPGRTTTDTYDIPGSDFLLHTKEIKDTASSKTRTWTYTYTTAADNTLVNLLKTVDGPRTDVADITTYTYYTADDTTLPIPKYRRGDLWKITNALNQATIITAYDGNGRPLTLIDPNTVTTTLAYWPRGWLKSKTVGSKTTSYDYDNVGQLTKVTLADGSFIQYTYDAAHRLTDISDTLLNRIHYTLDAIGNRIKEEVYDSNNTLSTRKSRDFDVLNRLWHDIAYFNDPNTPVATQYTYDANGNLTTVTPPANNANDTTYRTTTFSYDALDRLQNVIDPLNPTKPTQYSFDGLDQVRGVTDPRGLATTYAVNGLGSTTQQVSPDSATTNRTVDEAGNIKTETDAKGIQASYSYDALNRLATITYPVTGENITFTWDTGTGCTYGIGHVCQMTDGNGTTSYSYDDQGNLVKETRLEAGVSMVTQYDYDGANRRTSEITPTGETLVLGRNTVGRINTVTTTNGANTTILTKQTTYDGTGQIAAKLLGNGVKQGAGFDLSGQPASVASNKIDGDLNGDGVVNVVDMLFAMRIAEGLMTPTPDQLVHGDVFPPATRTAKSICAM